MKVRQMVEFSQEVDVEVGVEDIVAAIIEGDESLGDVLRSFSNFVMFAESIPDSIIGEFNDMHRSVITSKLTAIINRINS